jgi:hypothetical protein
MKSNIEHAMEILKPVASAPHAQHAAHSEIATELTRLDNQVRAGSAAIFYFLNRIKRDEKIRYHCGWGTETFSLMVAAAALYLEQSPEQVERYVLDEEAATAKG